MFDFGRKEILTWVMEIEEQYTCLSSRPVSLINASCTVNPWSRSNTTSLFNLHIQVRKMVILSPRIQFYEITDQDWFPQSLREKVQSCLAVCWTMRTPLFQQKSAAQVVAHTLSRVLNHAEKFVYVDLCAGAGGPTPTIDQELNTQLRSRFFDSPRCSSTQNSKKNSTPVKFVLTDLHPHVPEWTKISKRTENITFVQDSVDATDAPLSLKSNIDQKIFRLFNLSFHHFDDKLASDILRNSLETADGFGIFELQERTLSSVILILLMGLSFFLATPFYFWRSPGHLFFTYIIPIIPLVLILDGYVSSFRTRTTEEVLDLLDKCGSSSEDWMILSGKEQYIWPFGYMTWIIASKKEEQA